MQVTLSFDKAALLRFLALFAAGEVDGLYFALPTRTSAMQIYQRVLSAVQRVFPPGHQPPVVQAVPGFLVVDGKHGTPLPGFEVRWPDDVGDLRAARGWASENSKRFLAGSIVVGTIDQVLLSALAVRHSHLRASALLRHLLVVDEVHASDRYMSTILKEVLRHHLSSGGHALLMSATLGSAARSALLFADATAPKLALAEASQVAYPCFVHRQGQAVSEPRWVEADSSRARKVQVERSPIMDDAGAVARRALEAARGMARVLVIRNTVADALATQQAFETLLVEAGDPDLGFSVAHRDRDERSLSCHHARFAREDRLKLDEEIELKFRPGLREPVGLVAIATQTVQQSLDLDADLLITDLCPMDVLLQRIGRLHRDHRTGPRPEGFETPRVIVLVPEDRDLTLRIGRDGVARGGHGLGSVYSDLRSVECTWRILEIQKELDLPRECRRVVEETTHPEALALTDPSLADDPWQRHMRKVFGASSSERQIAELNLTPWAKSFGEFGLADHEGSIRTRLGDEDVRVRFEPARRSPFGGTLDEIQIPAYAFRGLDDDTKLDFEALAEVTDESVGALHFRFAGKAFVYDRLGLRLDESANLSGRRDDP